GGQGGGQGADRGQGLRDAGRGRGGIPARRAIWRRRQEVSAAGMSIMQAVRDRPFNEVELEQVRLLLSTFRDGAGQRLKVAGYMPDYLAFERVTALVLGGETNEDKGIFDVAVPRPGGKSWGVSCKM